MSLLNKKGETDTAGGWTFEPNRAVVNSRGCSEALWRMLSYGSMISALRHVVKDLQVFPGIYFSSSVRIKGWFIYLFSLQDTNPCAAPRMRRTWCILPIHLFSTKKWIMSHLQLGLTWFIVVNRIRASASLKNIQMHGTSGTELLASFFSSCDGHNDPPLSRGDLSGGSRQIIHS